MAGWLYSTSKVPEAAEELILHRYMPIASIVWNKMRNFGLSYACRVSYLTLVRQRRQTFELPRKASRL
jgi:hypothetical protein